MLQISIAKKILQKRIRDRNHKPGEKVVDAPLQSCVLGDALQVGETSFATACHLSVRKF